MTKSEIRDLVLETTSCFIAYDADSGDVLYIHESMSEPGPYETAGGVIDSEAIRQIASRDFEKRSIHVIEMPKGFEWKQGASYWVDPYCGELKELSAPVKTFREHLRQADSE